MFHKSGFLKCIKNSPSATDLTLSNQIFQQFILESYFSISSNKLEKTEKTNHKKKNKNGFLSKLRRCRTKKSKQIIAVSPRKVAPSSFDKLYSAKSKTSHGMLSSTLVNSTIEMNRRINNDITQQNYFKHFNHTIYLNDDFESASSSEDEDDNESIFSSYSFNLDSSLSSVSSLEFEPFESINSEAPAITRRKKKSIIKAPLISSSRSTLISTAKRPIRPVSSSRKSLLNLSECQKCQLCSSSAYCSSCCQPIDAISSPSTSLNICSSTLNSISKESFKMRNIIIKKSTSSFYSSVLSPI